MTHDVKIRVLIVDDDESQRDTIEAVLSDDFEVETVSSGSAALARLRRKLDIQVVVTDWQMPGMDGTALFRTIREERLAVACVLVTGRLEELRKQLKIDAAEGLAAFSKGSDPKNLINLIKTLGPLVRGRQAYGRPGG